MFPVLELSWILSLVPLGKANKDISLKVFQAALFNSYKQTKNTHKQIIISSIGRRIKRKEEGRWDEFTGSGRGQVTLLPVLQQAC